MERGKVESWNIYVYEKREREILVPFSPLLRHGCECEDGDGKKEEENLKRKGTKGNTRSGREVSSAEWQLSTFG